MDQTVLNKYLSGEATEPEIEQLFKWVEASAENRSSFIQYKQAWALTARSHDNSNTAWNKLNKEHVLHKRKNNFLLPVLKYAAVAILVFSLGGLSHSFLTEKAPQTEIYAGNTQFEVPLGQVSKVTLPDGTAVHLNSGSKLFYDVNFSSGNRHVELEGEAYFDVHSDKQHPFTIKTPGEISLKVYGTSFNVHAYANEAEINTTLVEGSLGVMDINGNELTRLVPGENAKFINSEKRIVVSKVKLDLYTSWKDGMVTFRDESLKEIALKIERWYNVEIIIEDPELANELYNGAIMKNKPIDQILEVFRLTTSLEYEIISRTDKPTLIYWK